MSSPTTKKNKSPLATFIAGGDLIAHRIAMSLGGVARMMIAVSVIFSLFFIPVVFFLLNEAQLEMIWATLASGFMTMLTFGSDTLTIELNDKTFTLAARDFWAHVVGAWSGAEGPIAQKLSEAWTKVFWIWAAISIATAPLYWLGTKAYMLVGFVQKTDEVVRGQKILEADQLSKLIEEEKEPSPIKIGDVPIPYNVLARNFAAIGSMGTGKSQAIAPMIEQARDWGKKMVIYDKTGEFTQKFYRPGKDILLNPVDRRCAKWTIFNDVKQKTDPAMVSKFFVPENKKSSDPFWDNAARMLLEDLIVIAQREKLPMGWVHEKLTRSTLEDLQEMLRENGSTSTGTINPENEKAAESIRMTLTGSPAIRFFPFFDTDGDFSVREFVADESDDGCIFITSSSTNHELIKPFASAWIALALAEVMRMKPTTNIRIMFFLDELYSLSKIPSMDMALTEARKFGISTLVGFQNLAQLDELYGKELAQVFIANLQNKFILRTEESVSAKRLSETLGSEDVGESSESQSFGAEANRDGVNVSAQRKERPLVTGTELMVLPDLTGWLKIAGDYPIAKVSIPYVAREDFEEGFVVRDGLDLDDEEGPDVKGSLGGSGGGDKNKEQQQDAVKKKEAEYDQLREHQMSDDLGIGI